MEWASVIYYYEFRASKLDYVIRKARETTQGKVTRGIVDVRPTEAEAVEVVAKLRAARDSELSQVYRNNIPT